MLPYLLHIANAIRRVVFFIEVNYGQNGAFEHIVFVGFQTVAAKYC